MQTMRTWLLSLGLLASTFVGCAGSLVREDDTLAGYRRELAKLVETSVLTKNDAEKFYRIASLEMERRANVASVPRHRMVYHWFDVYDLEEERL